MHHHFSDGTCRGWGHGGQQRRDERRGLRTAVRDGDSSRIYKSLVYEKRLAVAALTLPLGAVRPILR